MVAGLMYSLWIAQDQGLTSADPAELIEVYGSRVQSFIDGAPVRKVIVRAPGLVNIVV